MPDRSDNTRVDLSKDELTSLMAETVNETLVKLGIEAGDHREMQEDMIFLRQLRQTHEAVKRKTLLVLLGTIVAATAAAFWLGVKTLFTTGSAP